MLTSRKLVVGAFVLSSLALMLSIGALYTATNGLDLSGAGQTSFEARARAWLMANPEVVVESVRGLEQREQAADASEVQQMVRARADEIFRDPSAPVGGNPEGDATLVEFFDYNCPYCRKAAPHLIKAAKEDGQLRIVFKEFPILGSSSEFAARAALASQRQDKYEPYHHAMMSYSGQINEASALKLAGDVGLDLEKLKSDMEDPKIREAIARNLALARALRISGTPSWVVGEEIVRGLVDLPTLQKLVKEARASGGG